MLLARRKKTKQVRVLLLHCTAAVETWQCNSTDQQQLAVLRFLVEVKDIPQGFTTININSLQNFLFVESAHPPGRSCTELTSCWYAPTYPSCTRKSVHMSITAPAWRPACLCGNSTPRWSTVSAWSWRYFLLAHSSSNPRRNDHIADGAKAGQFPTIMAVTTIIAPPDHQTFAIFVLFLMLGL